MKTRMGKLVGVVTAAVALCLSGQAARGQDRGTGVRDDAALVLDGTVRDVFRNARPDRPGFLVQIEVKRSEAIRTPRTPPRVPVPAPGDLVYIHVPPTSTGGQQSSDTSRLVPAERSQIRAYLVAAAAGGWEGVGTDWFESAPSARTAQASGEPSPRATDAAPGPDRFPPERDPAAARAVLSSLGLTGESVNVKGQQVLRVTTVDQGGPAQRSGLEPGDIIVGLNDKALGQLDELDQLARQGGLKNLLVLDVNTGKTVRVPVEVIVAGRSSPPIENPPVRERPEAPTIPDVTQNPAPRAAGRSLGISAEPVRVGLRTAMKVTRVEPGSPAQQAGIEVNDILVAANGVPVTGAEALSAVVRKSGGRVTLTVRDTRTGKDVPVEVTLGAPDAAAPVSIPAGQDVQPDSSRKLGAVTELVFYDVDPAAKVTEVAPNSPAARAGIQPGDVIVEANGTPVLHPKTLDDLVRKSGPSLKLIVIDPRTNKKTSVEVNLGGR
jgi:S1-C subfamily serine protease